LGAVRSVEMNLNETVTRINEMIIKLAEQEAEMRRRLEEKS
jgi:hypothetical protein